ncbi:MAG: hypothetical protein ACE5HK_06245, partial [Candidatus Methylomirabilales bacterium]
TQVVQAMERMRTMVQQNASTSTELSGNAEGLLVQAEALQEAVSGFALAQEQSRDAQRPKFDITPRVQQAIHQEIAHIQEWARHPMVIAAVEEQNRRGPIPGMDRARWRSLDPSDPLVRRLQESEAGQFLKTKVQQGNGHYTDAFLHAVHGEKVTFVRKTSYYIHAGLRKFDHPFQTGQPWQGVPEFDESCEQYSLQVSVPVLSTERPIGVLTVGLDLGSLEQAGAN